MSMSLISLFRSIFYFGAAGLLGDMLPSAEADDGLVLACVGPPAGTLNIDDGGAPAAGMLNIEDGDGAGCPIKSCDVGFAFAYADCYSGLAAWALACTFGLPDAFALANSFSLRRAAISSGVLGAFLTGSAAAGSGTFSSSAVFGFPCRKLPN